MAEEGARTAGEGGALPAELGGYRLVRALSETGALAADESGRQVVLKWLDSDCLLRGQLHPMIRDRLRRVREIACPAVANLLSVERAAGRVYLVWEYVPGRTLGEVLAAEEHDAVRMRDIACQVMWCVERLHARGIVHGALHEGNVIIGPDGRVRLTHVSPLLYYETDVDVQAMNDMLRRMDCGWRGAGGGGLTMRRMAAELAGRGRTAEAPARRRAQAPGADLRRRTMLLALAACAAGAAGAWAAWRLAARTAESAAAAAARDARR